MLLLLLLRQKLIASAQAEAFTKVVDDTIVRGVIIDLTNTVTP